MPTEPNELRRRRTAARKLARERGFAGFIVTDPANLYYLSDYNAWSFYMPQAMFVDATEAGEREDALLFVMRSMDADGAHRTAQLPPEQVIGYPETLVHRPDAHPFDWAVTALRERGWVERLRDAPVAFEGDSHFFSPRAFLALREGLPQWHLRDGHGIVNWVRLVKSESEIALMRQAGRVASAAMAAAVEAIAPSVRENDIAAAISNVQIAGVGDADGDYPSIVPMLLVGEAADTPHLTWSAKRLLDDQALSIELAGAHQHYHAPLARSVTLGRVSDALLRLGDVTAEGLNAAIDAVRPGVTAHEVASAFLRVIEAAGFEKASRLGYSIGIGFPPDWGEGTVSIRRDDHTVLAPGMAFHLIAGMWIPGSSCELSESIVVSQSGVEVLTQAPRELIRKGAR